MASFDEIWPVLRHFLTAAVMLAAMWSACTGRKPKNKKGDDCIDAEYEEI